MKKTVSLLLILAMAMGAAGCASVQKKFTRKKKVPKHVAATIYLEEGAYQKKYSNDYYYKTHFTLWKSWHDELLIRLGGNSKKVSRCAQEALGELTEMSRYLQPEKQEELKPSLDEFSTLVRKIENGAYSSSEQNSIKFDLERIKRTVSNNFYYDKIKDKLLPDTVDLGTQEEQSSSQP